MTLPHDLPAILKPLERAPGEPSTGYIGRDDATTFLTLTYEDLVAEQTARVEADQALINLDGTLAQGITDLAETIADTDEQVMGLMTRLDGVTIGVEGLGGGGALLDSPKVSVRGDGANSTQVGVGATATGAYASASGAYASASGLNATATGFNAAASGAYASATGTSATATGNSATATGTNAGWVALTPYTPVTVTDGKHPALDPAWVHRVQGTNVTRTDGTTTVKVPTGSLHTVTATTVFAADPGTLVVERSARPVIDRATNTGADTYCEHAGGIALGAGAKAKVARQVQIGRDTAGAAGYPAEVPTSLRVGDSLAVLTATGTITAESIGAIPVQPVGNLYDAQTATLEGGIGTWASANFGAGSTAALDSGAAAYGTSSLLVTIGTTGSLTSANAGRVPVTAGQPHTAVASLMPVSGARSYEVHILWYTAATGGTTTAGPASVTLRPADNGRWTQLVASGTAPAGTTHAALRIYATGGTVGDQFRIDQCGIWRGTAETWAPPGGPLLGTYQPIGITLGTSGTVMLDRARPYAELTPAAGQTVTCTLPDLTAARGTIFTAVNEGDGVVAFSGQTTWTLPTRGSIEFVSNGSVWRVLRGGYSDRTVGLRRMEWDSQAKRFQATVADTGVRDITAVATPGAGNTIHSLLVQRVGSRVYMTADVTYGGATIGGAATLLTLPTGYAPSTRTIRDHVAANSVGSAVRPLLMRTAAIQVYGPTANDRYRWTADFNTADAWPTANLGTEVAAPSTLQGSAA